MADTGEEWAAAGVDVTVPSIARTAHSSLDGTSGELIATVRARHQDAAAPAVAFRSRAAIARFFDGLELVDPGLVSFSTWHADDLERKRPGGDVDWMLAAVGRKP